jgi:hypothetical protein
MISNVIQAWADSMTGSKVEKLCNCIQPMRNRPTGTNVLHLCMHCAYTRPKLNKINLEYWSISKLYNQCARILGMHHLQLGLYLLLRVINMISKGGNFSCRITGPSCSFGVHEICFYWQVCLGGLYQNSYYDEKYYMQVNMYTFLMSWIKGSGWNFPASPSLLLVNGTQVKSLPLDPSSELWICPELAQGLG